MKKVSKKLLAIMLAFVMVFALSATAFADGGETTTAPADGKYTAAVTVGGTNANMFKVINCTLTVKDGVMSAEIMLSGTGFSKLYMGNAEEAQAAEDGSGEGIIAAKLVEGYEYDGEAKDRNVFVIPVSALDEPVAVASRGSKNWSDKTITFDSSTLKLVKDEIPAPADGKYTAAVTVGGTNANMFKVINCTLTVKDGVMSAEIMLSGTGFSKLYMGNAEEAQAAEDGSGEGIIAAKLVEGYEYDGEVKDRNVFVIPVSALDEPVAVASRGSKSWSDKTLTLDASSLVLVDDEEIKEPTDDTVTTDPKGDDKKKEAKTSNVPGTSDDSALPAMAFLMFISAGAAVILNRKERA